jgi:hypothetical protein
LNFAFTEKVGESQFESFEVTSDSGPHHYAVEIDGLAVPAVTSPGADGTEKNRVW